MRGGRECTIVGTAGHDELIGTPHDDVICARGGSDFVQSLAGNDPDLRSRERDHHLRRSWDGRATRRSRCIVAKARSPR